MKKNFILKNKYITTTTLVKTKQRLMTIESIEYGTLVCEPVSMVLVEKNQTITIQYEGDIEHHDIKIIELPSRMMREVNSLYLSGKVQKPLHYHKNMDSRIHKTVLYPGMNETFDNVYDCLHIMKNCNCDESHSCDSTSEYTTLQYSLLFLLSPFITKKNDVNIFTRAVKSSLRERIYSIMKSNPTKKWNLDNIAIDLHTSRSTLKRKLAQEDTTFSEIYLDVRMNQAVKLLMTGGYTIKQVTALSGYNRPSYFITIFKKYFQMTPYKFMMQVNN